MSKNFSKENFCKEILLREMYKDDKANICKEVLSREISKKNGISYVSFCKHRARPTPEFNYGYKICKHNLKVAFINNYTRGCEKCIKEKALEKALENDSQSEVTPR